MAITIKKDGYIAKMKLTHIFLFMIYYSTISYY